MTGKIQPFSDFCYTPKELSDETVSAVEQAIGYHFPDDFKAFYKRYNGVALGLPVEADVNNPAMVFSYVDGELYNIECVFCITDYLFDPHDKNLDTSLTKQNPFLDMFLIGNTIDRYLPSLLLPFARDGAESLICISLEAHDYGSVYFVQGAYGGGKQHKLASSMGEYVTGLRYTNIDDYLNMVRKKLSKR